MSPRLTLQDMYVSAESTAGFEMRDAPTHARTKALLDYWVSKQNGRNVPLRADINPMHIPKLLPHIGLIDIERTDPPRFKIRLYGTEATETALEERSGRYIDDLASALPDEVRQITIDRWRQACTKAWETGAPVFTMSRPTHPQRQHQIVHTAALPLSTETGEINQLIGLMAIEHDLDDF